MLDNTRVLETTPAVGDPSRTPLTIREREIIELADRGLKNREIGEKLHIGEQTVKNHLYRIFSKLRVQGRHMLGAAHIVEPHDDHVISGIT